MYTKQNYSVRDMLYWTRHELVAFVLIALIPVILYESLDQRWLHLPWLPIALVGTAVAFIISFQNNATYGRAVGGAQDLGVASRTCRGRGASMVNGTS